MKGGKRNQTNYWEIDIKICRILLVYLQRTCALSLLFWAIIRLY